MEMCYCDRHNGEEPHNPGLFREDTNMAKQPQDYKHIAAWGGLLRSSDHYIRSEQLKALRDGAPLDAIYYDDLTEHRWITIEECVEATKQRIANILNPENNQ